MAKPLVPDELWKIIEPLIPACEPTSRGGRPPAGDRECLTGILFVLKTGIPWEDLWQEMGCGSGMTCWRQLRKRPDELYADRAYDSEPHRQELQRRGIIPHLARRNTEHGGGLGVFRWVSERTLGWLHGFRRLRVRFDRADELHEAFLDLAQSIICFRKLKKEFC